ncbi:ribulose bisphosphate carboxylase small chain 1A [Striga asiatica]|uniref:Ribulose bisphosphate carboxylase small chain 1A n=1 Tax=Striga asiatica TaxID=4170 RepID=A0A5A7QNF3_STRAF|nr:ribulose bisphosphate carboxylase small chain 1A [Striga asiatica]
MGSNGTSSAQKRTSSALPTTVSAMNGAAPASAFPRGGRSTNPATNQDHNPLWLRHHPRLQRSPCREPTPHRENESDFCHGVRKQIGFFAMDEQRRISLF